MSLSSRRGWDPHTDGGVVFTQEQGQLVHCNRWEAGGGYTEEQIGRLNGGVLKSYLNCFHFIRFLYFSGSRLYHVEYFLEKA